MTRRPASKPTGPLGPAVLTLVNGVGQPGQLTFPEHPGVEVAISGAWGIVLVALEAEWRRMEGEPTARRGWLNKQRLHEAYLKYIRHEVSPEAVGRYANLVIREIKRAFRHLRTPPVLLERDKNPRTRKGTHLVRDLVIEDLSDGGSRD